MGRPVVVVAYPGVQSHDVVGPFDVFAGASQLLAAQTGLLDGHRVTTPWALAAELAAPFPAVDVDPEPIESAPGDAHSVVDLARRAALSPRHFTRVFTEQIGEPPAAHVEWIRIDAARRQLEESADTVSVIAERCGFGSTETMRRNFVRRLGGRHRCRRLGRDRPRAVADRPDRPRGTCPRRRPPPRPPRRR